MLEIDMGQQTKLSRRRVITTAGAVGVIGLAGCTGGDDGDDATSDDGNGDNGGNGGIPEGDYVLGTAGEATAVHGGSVGLASEVSSASDILNINARTTPGTSANPRLLDRGEIDIAAGSDLNAWEANQGIGSYEDPVTERTMCQSAATHTVEVFLAKRDTPELEDVEMVTDIPQDVPMTWGAPGSSGYFYFQYGFEMLGLENPVENYNLVNMNYGEIADAFRENRVDIGIYLTLSQTNLPGYIQEVESAADMEVIEWDFTEEEMLAADNPFSYAEIDGNLFADFRLDSVPALSSVYTTYFPLEFNDDHVYEFLDVAMAQHEEIQQYHATVSGYGPDFAEEWMIQSDYVPIHPGAEQWYVDNDMWDDSWPSIDDYDDPR